MGRGGGRRKRERKTGTWPSFPCGEGGDGIQLAKKISKCPVGKKISRSIIIFQHHFQSRAIRARTGRAKAAITLRHINIAYPISCLTPPPEGSTKNLSFFPPFSKASYIFPPQRLVGAWGRGDVWMCELASPRGVREHCLQQRQTQTLIPLLSVQHINLDSPPLPLFSHVQYLAGSILPPPFPSPSPPTSLQSSPPLLSFPKSLVLKEGNTEEASYPPPGSIPTYEIALVTQYEFSTCCEMKRKMCLFRRELQRRSPLRQAR